MSLQPLWLCPNCLAPHTSPDFPIPCPECPKETN